MSAHRAAKRYGRAALALVLAVGSIGLMGCDESPSGPEIPDGLDPVVVNGETAPVRAGGYIGVIVSTPEEGDAWFRATVSWDPSGFEHIRFDPHRPSVHTTEDLDAGWIAVEDETTPYLPKGQIVFLFRALRDTNTSGFSVYMEDSTTER